MASSLILEYTDPAPSTILVDGTCYLFDGVVSSPPLNSWANLDGVYPDCISCHTGEGMLSFLWREETGWVYGTGPGTGITWYRTDYAGYDIEDALVAEWYAVNPIGVTPSPVAFYFSGLTQVIVSDAGLEMITGAYYPVGDINGAPAFSQDIASSSSSSSLAG